MVRGHAKEVAQQKSAAKMASKASNGTQRGAADVAMIYKCPLCMTTVPNVKLYKTHYDIKHPAETFPAEAKAELDALEAKKAADAAAKAKPSGAAAEGAPPKKKKQAEDLSALLLEGLAAKGKKK